MKAKLIIFVHGIGDADKDFHLEWEKVVAKNNDLEGITVKGFLWEDSLQKAADMYDFGSGPLGDILKMCGFPQLAKWSGNDDWKVIKDYMMDVLIYVGLQEMWLKIQNECALELDKLRRDEDGNEQFKKTETILVGHSLGAAMLPHLVWREYAFSGSIPYHGMILLASPLGFLTPNKNISQDFLQRMGEIYGGERSNVLARFARAWNKKGPGRLKFISNENDIICSDVKFPIPGTDTLVDPIPIRQGFDPAETYILNKEHPGCMETIAFGKCDLRQIAANHDVLAYLKHATFTSALATMLE